MTNERLPSAASVRAREERGEKKGLRPVPHVKDNGEERWRRRPIPSTSGCAQQRRCRVWCIACNISFRRCDPCVITCGLAGGEAPDKLHCPVRVFRVEHAQSLGLLRGESVRQQLGLRRVQKERRASVQSRAHPSPDAVPVYVSDAR